MGRYGKDGQPRPANDGGMPFTDYEVRVQSILKADGKISEGGTIVLRMFGHCGSSAIITPIAFTHPDPGDYLLFALGGNSDRTYGTGPEGLFNVDGDKVKYADGEPFATDVSPEQFIREVTAD